MTNLKISIIGYRALGTAILDRLAAEKVPASLKSAIKGFADANKAYDEGAAKVDATRALRDTALAAIGDADALLDQGVLGLADKLVAAGLGNRRNPFATFSKLAPEALCTLAYLTEVTEVEKLCAAITKKKPPADVKAAVTTCLKNAAAVKGALAKISAPQAAYAKAMAARDTTLLAWQKALTRLKKHVAAEWDDDPARVKAIFAPVDKMQAPVHKRNGKAAKAPAPTPAPVTPAG